MSVLAHVVSRSLAPEPAATQALGYILTDAAALRAFVRQIPRLGERFDPRRVEIEATVGEGRPDLVIYGSGDAPRVMVENKFWAGLTEAQPAAYLAELPTDDQGAALVFVVPEVRVRSIWAELMRRCTASGLSVGEDVSADSSIASAHLADNRLIVVTSWQSVLDRLASVADVRSDVQQLRALTDRMDAEAFLPIRPDELTDIGMVRRLMNYADLVEAIVAELKRRGVADTTGLRPSHAYHATGRYLYMHDRLGLWLGVDLGLWHDSGTTPLWWVMLQNEWSGVDKVWADLEKWVDDLWTAGPRKCVPIRLRTGVERDVVVDDAADQMATTARKIVDGLNNE